MYRTLPIITTHARSDHNPGDIYIGAGAQWVCEQVAGEALPWKIIDKFDKNHLRESAGAMKNAGLTIYGGTPQYNRYSEWKLWYDDEFWRKLINPNNIPVAVLAGGSGTYRDESPERWVKRMTSDKLTMKIINQRRPNAECFTVRDKHSHALLNAMEIDHSLLPCTAVFSGHYHDVPFNPVEGRVAIVPPTPTAINKVPAERVIDRFKQLMDAMREAGKRPVLVCHLVEDADAFTEAGETDIFFTTDYVPLLKFYGTCEGLISARLHGTLPAWGIGARSVVNITIDSRGWAAEEIGVENLLWDDASVDALMEKYHGPGRVDDRQRDAILEQTLEGYRSVLKPVFERTGWM